MRANAWHALVLSAGVAACEVVEPVVETEEPTYGPGLGTAENPIPWDGVTYEVRSRIARDTDGLAPDVAEVVATLRAFSERPAATLLAIAGDTPELAQLYATLPASLESQLAGWIDVELDKASVGGSGIASYAATLAGFAETVLTRFTLDSTMSFTPARAAHTVTSIVFELDAVNVVVPIGGLKADEFDREVVVAVAEAGVITFGEHQFGLAFGEHVWHGLNLASRSSFDVDVQTALVGSIDCGALAVAVASRCIDGQCVGQQGLIETVCTGSLQRLASDLAARIAAFDSDVVHHVSGTARLIDDNRDGLADRIADGIWQSELVVGPARGTFTALAESR